MVLGIMVEENWSFSTLEAVLRLAEALAEDRKTQSQIQLSRTTASYKLTHGFAVEILQKTVRKLKENKFSLNVDEATSLTNKKVLSILSSIATVEGVDVDHLASDEVSDSFFINILFN